MAENYLHYSVALDGLTADEKQWIKNLKAAPSGQGLDQFVDNEFPYPDTVLVDNDTLYLHDNGYGDVEAAINLIQAFLTKFRPNQAVGVTYAVTCSKPRPDEFHGGAVFITATNVDWMSAGSWLADRIRQHGLTAA